VDLYLIHWPIPSKDLFMETWRAFIKLKEEGRAKSIGVSNFRTADLERILKESDVTPVLNQIELHPQFQQDELRLFHSKHDIATEAWSPLGQGTILENPTLKTIADKLGKSVAQVILRWHIETGNIVIPKSVTLLASRKISIFSISASMAPITMRSPNSTRLMAVSDQIRTRFRWVD
jgi:2,5-diketo-D-gluconate reductase A